MNQQNTESENAFESFCNENLINFIRIEAGPESRPDYEIVYSNGKLIAEVKELRDSPFEKPLRSEMAKTGSTGVYNPNGGKRVRKRIDESRDQLNALTKGKFPGMVVLWDRTSIIPIHDLEIRLGMFGEDIVNLDVDESQSPAYVKANHHFGKGQTLRTDANTTVSAVALLLAEPGGIKMKVFHNHFAVNTYSA